MTIEPRFLLIGNPENRRITGFVEALQKRGQPRPHVLSHLTVLADPSALTRFQDEDLIVRIDSVGENDEVEAALLALGYEDAARLGVHTIDPEQLRTRERRRGEILCPRQHHLGQVRHLRRMAPALDAGAASGRWLVQTDVESVIELFDKRITAPKYADLGVDVPAGLVLEDVSPEGLRSAMRRESWSAAFVKLSCSSSASGLAVFRVGKTGPGVAMTTVRETAHGRFNSLKIQRIDDGEAIDRLLTFLLREGARVERALPKARLGRGFFDCRVLVVHDEPAFVVVRQSRHPITNLHLGGWRGDLEALRRSVDPAAWASAMESCRRVFGAHRNAQVGVDLAFRPDFASHFVIEANAFGDLLPRLMRDGLDVYEYQIERALERWRARA